MEKKPLAEEQSPPKTRPVGFKRFWFVFFLLFVPVAIAIFVAVALITLGGKAFDVIVSDVFSCLL